MESFVELIENPIIYPNRFWSVKRLWVLDEIGQCRSVLRTAILFILAQFLLFWFFERVSDKLGFIHFIYGISFFLRMCFNFITLNFVVFTFFFLFTNIVFCLFGEGFGMFGVGLGWWQSKM
uniref:Uncharacterized protein n=1 Tax=Cannabis sativa TaxID=3483 RepID=A0A803R0K9_CANSA